MRQKIITSTLTYWGFIGILAMIAFFLFSSHIYAQSPSSNLSFTQKRLNAMKEYQKAAGRFAWLEKIPEAKPYYDAYIVQNEVGVVEGDRCRENLEQQSTQKRKDCDNNIKTHFKKIRHYYRFMKYQELVHGAKNVCVKADMGVNPALTAKGIAKSNFSPDPANPKETGLTGQSTVYLCADGEGKKKLRVRTASGKYVKLTAADLARPELQISNLPPAANIAALKDKIDLDK